MKKGVYLLLLVIYCILISNLIFSQKKTSDVLSIIPKPASIIIGKGEFLINAKTKVVIANTDDETKRIANDFVNKVNKVSGFNLSVGQLNTADKQSSIVLTLLNNSTLGDEGYVLNVNKEFVELSASKPNGLFYGIQTIYQLLPIEIENLYKVEKKIVWAIPCVNITDKPRFSWRGLQLDVSRHFFPKDFIKKYIDFIAMHKMNIFHWHLCDDQGWRIESKKYPKLSEISAWRVDREDKPWGERPDQKPGEKATYGGFYTQEEIKEIVQYAKEKFITVVPEIEMPAHTMAVLAAYPEYSCTGGPFTVPPGSVWPITQIFCAGNDKTFSFIENILGEVMELFPSRYIHIGGDEANKTEWKKCPKCQERIKNEKLKDEAELQSYFIKRVEKFIVSKDRKLIGWDEILEGGLAPEAAVMSWRGMEGGIEAAKQKHLVVMTPTTYCYFDYYQGDRTVEPLGIGGFLPLQKVYSFDPVPAELSADEAKYILGGQANLWTEFIPTTTHAEYMLLPRLDALAEVVWSPKESRNFDDFVFRLDAQFKRYNLMKLNYAKSANQVDITSSPDLKMSKLLINLKTATYKPAIRYTLDGTEPNPNSKLYDKPFFLEKTSVIKAKSFNGKDPLYTSAQSKIVIHKARQLSLATNYSPKYIAGGDNALIDGMIGSKNFADGKWQGYEQENIDAFIDLGKIMPIEKVTLNAIQNSGAWVIFPKSIEIAVSKDNKEFSVVALIENDVSPLKKEIEIKEFSAKLKNINARYLKILVKNIGNLPEGHSDKGGKAWLFVDEIIVE